MTITDDYIDALIAEHYPAHTSPQAEIHHRESIRAIVEDVASEYEWAIGTTRQDCARRLQVNWNPKEIMIDTIQSLSKRAIAEQMEDLQISRAELARRLDVSRAAITQMFRDEEWTLERLQRVAEAVGVTVHLQFKLPKEAQMSDVIGTMLECDGTELREDGTCEKCERIMRRVKSHLADLFKRDYDLFEQISVREAIEIVETGQTFRTRNKNVGTDG